MRCSRCQLVHYCSRECQVTDWKKGHKPICFPVEVHKMEAENLRLTSQWCSARVEESEQMRRQVLAADPKCSICFEQPMVQPIVLERCHHAFCFSCLKGWNNVHQTQNIFAPSTMTCPLCRQEIPNIVETINADILLLLTSAHEMNASESFVLEQCTKALDKMELLKDIEQAVKEFDEAIQAAPQSSSIGYFAGKFIELSGDKAKAIRYYKIGVQGTDSPPSLSAVAAAPTSHNPSPRDI